MDSLLNNVENLLRHVAGQEILSRFGKLGPDDVHTKNGPFDVVTTADLESENRIREGLLKLIPESMVVGEEEAFKNPESLARLNGSAPVWLIDPLDGTGNFVKGKPCFAVICALVENGITQMGWIFDPITDVCIFVKRGCGVYLGDQQLFLKVTDLELSSMMGSLGEGLQKRLQNKPDRLNLGHLVRYHCVGREYMDLALGKLNFALYGGKMMPWDHAAGVLMVEEAGGYVRTIGNTEFYSPLRHGSGDHLLVTPDKKTFNSLNKLLFS